MSKIIAKATRTILAANVRHLRKLSGLTQSQLAEEIGWKNQGMVSQVENGKTGIGPGTIETLASFFHVELSDMYRLDLSEGYPRIVRIPVFQAEIFLEKKELVFVDFFLVASSSFLATDKMPDQWRRDQKPFIFRFPVWLQGRNVDKIIGLISDPSGSSPEIPGEKVMSLIDQAAIPEVSTPDQTVGGRYLVKLKDGIDLFRVEKTGHRLLIHNKAYRKEDEYAVDLRIDKDRVVGKLIGSFTQYP